MKQVVLGNTHGLSPSQIRLVEKLYSRALEPEQIVSQVFAFEVYEVAKAIGRRVGALIDRDGKVQSVFVGSREILYLPDLGRYRLGRGRLRNLRLVYSDLSKDPEKVAIPTDIFTDLEKLRLDAVVGVKGIEANVRMSFAHLKAVRDESVAPVQVEQDVNIAEWNRSDRGDFLELMAAVEEEIAEYTSGQEQKGDAALLVGVYKSNEAEAKRSMAELKELARTAGVRVVGEVVQRKQPDPKTILGKGKLEEVVLRCLRLEAELLIFDGEIKPHQWRAITNSTELKVLDRSMLILDIFAQRASSSDGKLQVELAQLKYNLPRLVEKDAGLSRLSGGIGGRGPGETKLEIGRRRIRDRITELEKRIDKLGEQRQLRRGEAQRRGVPLVALLGYTNAGKSTLFNTLTKGDVLVEDKLFATLETTKRQLHLKSDEGASEEETRQRENDDYSEHKPGINLIVSDTVGFIRDLPSELSNAFRATLEELSQASLFVHVVDISESGWEERINSVNSILKELEFHKTPVIMALNKLDAVSEPFNVATVDQPQAIAVIGISSLKKEGILELRGEIAKFFRLPRVELPVVESLA